MYDSVGVLLASSIPEIAAAMEAQYHADLPMAFVDPISFELTGELSLDGRPTDAVLLDDGRLFARDEFSGLLLETRV